MGWVKFRDLLPLVVTKYFSFRVIGRYFYMNNYAIGAVATDDMLVSIEEA